MSKLPDPKYMAICSVAMGISALIQNFIRAIILISYPSTDFIGIFIYYGISALIVLTGALMYFVEKNSEFAKNYFTTKAINSDSNFFKRLKNLWK
jgi:hypothetical protein